MVSEIITIVVKRVAGREPVVGWYHKSDSGVESGCIFRYFSVEPLSLEEKIKSAKKSAVAIMGFSKQQVNFSVGDRR